MQKKGRLGSITVVDAASAVVTLLVGSCRMQSITSHGWSVHELPPNLALTCLRVKLPPPANNIAPALSVCDDATSLLGDAESSLGDTKSSL
jgi:hypothetical protein